MTKLTRTEKALVILKESKNAFDECSKQLRETEKAFRECEQALNSANTYLKRVLNEEVNGGSIHKDCEYYNSEDDYCSNYIMGIYSNELAFEVSRHKTCIKDIVEGDNK
jgi:hypothetical protein